jgi:Fic family protein
LSTKDTDFKSSVINSESRELTDLAVKLRERCALLSSIVHPLTRNSIEDIIRVVNTYYSCKSEGHEISPLEIEKALQGNYSRQKSLRLIQHEAIAYIETGNEMMENISGESGLNICSLEFISWIHRVLYEKLPGEFRKVRNRAGRIIYVIPGELREEDLAETGGSFPKAKRLRKLLFKFEKDFNPKLFNLSDSLIAVAEAYRQFWHIHPFLSGNGMVLRLFTKAYFRASLLNGINLFSFSRAEHNNSLKNEKLKSDDGSVNFTGLFLKSVLNEIEFMIKIFNPDNVIEKLNSYAEKLINSGELKEESRLILKSVFLSGELKRGEALVMTGRPERTARRILGELLQKKLLVSDTPKGRLRMNFSLNSAMEIFSGLFGKYFVKSYFN